MQIQLTKGEHKILLKTDEKLVSMVSWNGITREKNITGIRSEWMDTKREATVLFRKMSNLLQSNGYNLLQK